jgi:hypothetical protein
VVNSLENLNIQLLGLRRFERHTKGEERVGQTLDTQSNWPVPEVAAARLLYRIVVDFNNLVEVTSDNLGDLVKLFEVVAVAVIIHESWKGKRSKVADSDLIRSGVFNYLCAKVGTTDGSQVLLVALAVAGVFVEHVGISGLGLGFEDSIPQLLSTHCIAPTSFSFISAIISSTRDGG